MPASRPSRRQPTPSRQPLLLLLLLHLRLPKLPALPKQPKRPRRLRQLRRLSYPLQLSQVLPLQPIPRQRLQLRCQPQGNCRLKRLATLLNLET
jgi:hypothetical protein